jgi:hypothetical protein
MQSTSRQAARRVLYYERSACDRRARHRKAWAIWQTAARRKKPRTPGEQLAQVGGRAGHQPTACGGCRSLPKVRPSTHSGRKGSVGEWVNWRAGCPSVHWPLADDPTQYPIGTTLEGRQIDGRSSRRFRPFFENRSSPAKWFTIPSQSSPS